MLKPIPLVAVILAMLVGFATGIVLTPVLAQQGTIWDTGELTLFQDSSGVTGTLWEPTPGLQLYQDSTGRTGSIYEFSPGFNTYQFSEPLNPC